MILAKPLATMRRNRSYVPTRYGLQGGFSIKVANVAKYGHEYWTTPVMQR